MSIGLRTLTGVGLEMKEYVFQLRHPVLPIPKFLFQAPLLPPSFLTSFTASLEAMFTSCSCSYWAEI